MLSLLCITKAELAALPFLRGLSQLSEDLNAELVLAADGAEAADVLGAMFWAGPVTRIVPVESKGYLESVHDEAVSRCTRRYVLRLDDDERVSPAMQRWLFRAEYGMADHWKFPRANLWGDAQHYIDAAPLWPDHQTRLSVRKKAGGRNTIHCGSPFGGGELAPVAIEHHTFLIRGRAERMCRALERDRIQPGAGTGGFLPFNCPEDVYDPIPLAKLGDGTVR